ncbi:MAG: SIMPL domain-containing protein [archaeon]
MRNSTIIGTVIILLVLGLVIVSVVKLTGFSKSNEKTIDVTGTSTIKKPADKASLSVGIETQNINAQDAEAENREVSDEIYSSLEELGLTSQDYQTQSYNIYPNRDWQSGSNITGYTVTHMINIDTDKIDTVPEILSRVVQAGANNIYGIQFTLKDDTKELARVEGYKQATDSARMKAEAIASGLKVEITDIVRVSDTSIDYMPYFRNVAMADVAMEGSSLEIESGSVEVTSSVSVSYGFR